MNNKNFTLLSIILFLCCWDTPLFSMEERESEASGVIAEGSSLSSAINARMFKFLIGGEEFEVSSTIVQHIKAIQNMIEDLEKSEEATEIDTLFPKPEAVEENQKNFKIIIALLSNQEHGYSYTMEDHISLLNCANKLNVEAVLNVGIATLADHIDIVEEIDDELLNQLKNLNHDLFLQVCSQLKFINPVLLEILLLPSSISRLGFLRGSIKSISFNKAKTKVAFIFEREIYVLDLESKILEEIFRLDSEGLIPFKALKFTQSDNCLIIALATKIIVLDLENKKVVKEELMPEFWDASKEDERLASVRFSNELCFPAICSSTFKRKIKWYIENKENSCVSNDFAFDRSGKFLATAKIFLFAIPGKPTKPRVVVEVWDSSDQHNIENLKLITRFECKDFEDSATLYFHPTEPLLAIKVKKDVLHNLVYIGNIKTGSLEKIFEQDRGLLDMKFDSNGSNLYIACIREGLYRFDMNTKKLMQLIKDDHGYTTFDISDDDSLISIGTRDKVILYKLGTAFAKQITNVDELCFLKKMERLRSEDKKLALYRHNNPEMYAAYQGASFASDLSKSVQAGCSFDCYLNDIKQIIKKPFVIAGAVGAVALAGYVAYKKWFRA